MELVLGGVAAVGAGLFSNPLDVIKIRMQLQGELQRKGQYVVNYKNAFQAGYIIARKDGILALQKGLTPALWFQFVMNGTRLGCYQMAQKRGWTTKAKNPNEVDPIKSLVVGAACGVLGGTVGSPLYLVKTHLQSLANEKSIAVGYQHQYKGMTEALLRIYKKQGIKGLWRGNTSAMARISVASGIQLVTFEKALEMVKDSKMFHSGSWFNPLFASMVSGLIVSFGMAPFDLVATRFYNQGTNSYGTGILYKSLFECVQKVYKEEGVLGFYKGWTANYFRMGPHTLFCLVFWERLKYYHGLYEQRQEISS